MKNNEKLNQLLKNSENSFIISTKSGVGICGNGIDILTQFAILIETLREHFPDYLLKSIVESILKKEKKSENIKEKNVEKIEELFKELKKMLMEL